MNVKISNSRTAKSVAWEWAEKGTHGHPRRPRVEWRAEIQACIIIIMDSTKSFRRRGLNNMATRRATEPN